MSAAPGPEEKPHLSIGAISAHPISTAAEAEQCKTHHSGQRMNKPYEAVPEQKKTQTRVECNRVSQSFGVGVGERGGAVVNPQIRAVEVTAVRKLHFMRRDLLRAKRTVSERFIHPSRATMADKCRKKCILTL
eukprot:582537-Rhodomonas_salina.1